MKRVCAREKSGASLLARVNASGCGRERVITGIAWDHRRCWGPLEASIGPYLAEQGQEVRWDRRSLYSFGEGDLGNFAERYDLVIYDLSLIHISEPTRRTPISYA